MTWLNEMTFEADIYGHKIYLDVAPEKGGNNMGPKPKAFMMVALGGCTGMDVVSVLRKMRVTFDSLEIRIEGNVTEEHPKHFDRMKVIYEFSGKDLEMDKLVKAVELSREKYCGVMANYRESMEIDYEIRIL